MLEAKGLSKKIKNVKRDIKALNIAYGRPDVPFRAKIAAALVLGYALSPVDLIPDFIPVLGYLDDLLIIPFGIYLTLKLIPENIMEECRKEADGAIKPKNPLSIWGGVLIMLIWIMIIGTIFYKLIFK